MATDKKSIKRSEVTPTGNGIAGINQAAVPKKAKPASEKNKPGIDVVAENVEKPAAEPAVKAETGKKSAQDKKSKAAVVASKEEAVEKKAGKKKGAEKKEMAKAEKEKATEIIIEPKEINIVEETTPVAEVGKVAATKKASKKIEAPKKGKAAVAVEKPEETKKPEKKASSKKEKAELLIDEKPEKTDFEKIADSPVKEQPKMPEAPKVAITFQIRYHTKFGQRLFITAAHQSFGNGDLAKALPMKYLNTEFWTLTVKLDKTTIPATGIIYNYFLKLQDGSTSFDWGTDKVLFADAVKTPEVFILDSWNFAGYFENAFYTEPFKQVLLKKNYTPVTTTPPENITHIFKVKAPLLAKGQTIAVSGGISELGSWGTEKFVLLSRNERDDFFTAGVDLNRAAFPVMYKYLVYDIEGQKVVRFEGGNNRTLYNSTAPGRQIIINDGFAVLPANTWKGAGVAVPVFSLRSTKSGGIGEFADINLLVDWAKKTGLRLVQILPVNDTTATHTWTDSYPYAAISAFALHPMYLRLEDLVADENKGILQSIAADKAYLNGLTTVDYEAVNNIKWNIIRQVYPLQKHALFASEGYKEFFQQNSHWLKPYAVFCYLRDKYHTADFNNWPLHKNYVAVEIEALVNEALPQFTEIAIHFFVQYHLHVQLKQATQYAHENGVIVKGDIPIGVYRYGADAWQNPQLYHMDMQAGAPPDDFAKTGQNWGFPTYNWENMRSDGFAWWKQRLEQMSYYFDAFRIDHILGFFRIWAVPINQVEGIMGHFEPSIPVHKNEFNEKGIWFDYNRYCRPYITDKVLSDSFGDQQNYVRHHFLNNNGPGVYQFKPEYATQRQLETYFTWQKDNAHNRWLKQALYNLISNVILFEVEGSNGLEFHFRFAMENTSSFKNIDENIQQQLKGLYVNYYFKRQDNFWMKQALQTLPALKRVTNMLVCGEDLGLVPACVPEVMRQLGLLSLEIQRMPKDSKKEFFHPADAPYLSVITPSTHDMSTIRGWWEEDRAKTQKFYNNELGQWGAAPHFCEAWVNKAIVVQHLHSPGMWSIFQLQDLLGIDKVIRRDDPHEERINVPAIPKYYWRYRMHLTLEQLLAADGFNTELLNNVKGSGRL